MSKVTELQVTVRPVLTIDDETAYVILGLLELYCRANEKTIEVVHRQVSDSSKSEVVLSLVKEKWLQ